jgi:hypothetical protein
MRKIIYILSIVLAAVSCADIRHVNPYEEGLHVLTVTPQWPETDLERSGAEVRVEDMNTGSRYVSQTGADGTTTFVLPNGLYRVTLSGRDGSDVFNASADKVVVSGCDYTLALTLSISRAGSIVIKELYCGGCKKLPQEGDYQADQYIILHNNDYQVQYLDGICFGTLSPYNSTGANPWISADGLLPEFIPLIQAVWQFPGDGDDFPLQPGEDAVVCLRGAIDHSAQYPLSVNLNKPDYFVCYNSTYFNNTAYHPAPGNLISQDRYLDVVIKTGKANAYTMSLSSPAVVIFRAEGITIQDYVLIPENVTPVPGSAVDNVVKVPYEWVLDAMEVFDGRSASNQKRLAASADAGYVSLSDTFLGHTLMRRVDEEATAQAGYEILADTNNSLNDFYETEKQSLHE